MAQKRATLIVASHIGLILWVSVVIGDATCVDAAHRDGIHQHHHVTSTSLTCISFVHVRPTLQRFGYKRRMSASAFTSTSSRASISCAQTSARSTSHSSTRRSIKKRKIQWVPWSGNGMLPHQHYSGVMHRDEYLYWLRAPLPSPYANVVKTAPVDNYFLSLANASSNGVSPPSVKATHLKPIYIDDHIIVLNKPSGVLSVPGPRRHECVTTLAYRYFGKSQANDVDEGCGNDNSDSEGTQIELDSSWQPLTNADNKQIDTMVVHRLDRDTSGVFLLARNDEALKTLHDDFKDKTRGRVTKRYVALVCGHWNNDNASCVADRMTTDEGEIDLPLVRDIENPPFMRVATVDTALQQQELKIRRTDPAGEADKKRQHTGFLRMVSKGSKQSLTTYRILSYEYLIDYEPETGNEIKLPVTRVELQPITGRTHQLRVHCAAMGYPIVGDSIYGYGGEGSPRGGLDEYSFNGSRKDLQVKLRNFWKRRHSDSQEGIEMDEDGCLLCLHAQRLTIFHPLTKAPMMFECSPPF